MGLCFRKSISLGKGVKLNLSKSGPSISFGKSGLRQTISLTGKSTTSVGIPGTGIYYRKQFNLKKLGKKFFGKDKKSEKTKAKGKDNESEVEVNEDVAEYEEYIEALKSIHRVCDDTINWDEIRRGEMPDGVKKNSDEYKSLRNLVDLADKVLEGDIDAYLQVVEEMDPFEDLIDFGSCFEVGTESSDAMSVEFQVKSEDIIPTVELKQLASGKTSEKEMSKTNYYALLQDYVCSTVIRVARDTFALLPVNTCYVHVVDTVLDSATGNDEEVTILSVAIDRDKLDNMNMDRLDPSDALDALGANMKFKKTAGFDPVDRVE